MPHISLFGFNFSFSLNVFSEKHEPQIYYLLIDLSRCSTRMHVLGNLFYANLWFLFVCFFFFQVVSMDLPEDLKIASVYDLIIKTERVISSRLAGFFLSFCNVEFSFTLISALQLKVWTI